MEHLDHKRNGSGQAADDDGPNSSYARHEQGSGLFRAALCVLLHRAGGEIVYTENEFASISEARGEFVIAAKVENSGPGEPVVRVRLTPSNHKGTAPIS